MMSWGQVIYGDAGDAIIVTIKNLDGTVRNVTSALNIVLRWQSQNGVSGTISGTVVSPGTAGQFRFASPGTQVDPGADRLIVPMDFVVEWTESGVQYKSRDIGRYEIRRFP